MLVHVERAALGRDQHVLGVLRRVVRLHVDDLAEVVRKLVVGRDVVDAVAELHHVPRIQARQLHVEVAGRRVHADRRVVRGALAGLDGLVYLAVAAEHARTAQLNHLAIRLVLERVLARHGCGGVREGLEHDLAELAGQAVGEHRGHRQVPQGAARLAVFGRVPQAEEALLVPGVGFVRPRLGGLDVLHVLAHVLVLRTDLQD